MASMARLEGIAKVEGKKHSDFVAPGGHDVSRRGLWPIILILENDVAVRQVSRCDGEVEQERE